MPSGGRSRLFHSSRKDVKHFGWVTETNRQKETYVNATTHGTIDQLKISRSSKVPKRAPVLENAVKMGYSGHGVLPRKAYGLNIVQVHNNDTRLTPIFQDNLE